MLEARLFDGVVEAVDVVTDERIAGKFDGIEPDGAMRLRVKGGGVEVIRAGEVSLA